MAAGDVGANGDSNRNESKIKQQQQKTPKLEMTLCQITHMHDTRVSRQGVYETKQMGTA